MDDVLRWIGQFGVIPLLIIAIYVLAKVVEKLHKKNEELQNEMLKMEKENTALLYKNIAVLNKITDNDGKQLIILHQINSKINGHDG